MELAEMAENLLGIYNDMSTELGAVLAVVLLSVLAIALMNARGNARMQQAQSNTQDTINELVRSQSKRSAEATEEAKRLNDLLRDQERKYNDALHEQSKRLTALETQLPLYKEEIEDLKQTRETLLEVVMTERKQHREEQRETEERHLKEMEELNDKFETNRAASNELRRELSALKARLEERERERDAHTEEIDQITALSNSVAGLQVFIEQLTKAITDEFKKLHEFNYIIADALGSSASVGTKRDAERVQHGHAGSGGDSNS